MTMERRGAGRHSNVFAAAVSVLLLSIQCATARADPTGTLFLNTGTPRAMGAGPTVEVYPAGGAHEGKQVSWRSTS